MHKYLAAVVSRCKALLVKKFGPLPILGIAVALFFLIAGIFFQNWLADQGKALKQGWSVLMGTPIRFFGLLTFLVLVGLMLVAFVDTSPVAAVLKEWLNRKKLLKRKPLTVEERLLIRPLRAGWEQYCKPISEYQESFFWDYRNAVGNDDWPWFKLTRPIQQRAEASRKEMAVVIEESSNSPFKNVKDGLAVWYQAYMELTDLMAQMRATESRIKDDVKLAAKLEEYRRYHAGFRKEMLNLAHGMTEYSDLRLFSDTHIEWRLFNQVTAEFLLASPGPQSKGETTPKPSASDSVAPPPPADGS
jgi:hypothetical protein